MHQADFGKSGQNRLCKVLLTVRCLSQGAFDSVRRKDIKEKLGSNKLAQYQ